jgi:nucleotide-binding universal stress UspA family protein
LWEETLPAPPFRDTAVELENSAASTASTLDVTGLEFSASRGGLVVITAIPTRVSLKNILVATDFSPCSEAILPYARSLALHYDSTVFITHVISPEVLSVDPFMMEAAHHNVEQGMERLESSEMLADVPHKQIVEEGPTWEVLKWIIEREKIDLVIVGTHGRTGLKRLVMGSVAEDIFRHAPCPVLTLGPRVCTMAKRDTRFSHVLFATDLKAENRGAVLYAASLATEHNAHLTLLHVAEIDRPVPLTKQLLDLLPEQVELRQAPEAVIEVGDPAERILHVAASRHADLIVLGAHRPALLTTHLMDVAYRVVCEAPCPVLTVGAEYHE